jgi:HEPN domain-containing protein
LQWARHLQTQGAYYLVRFLAQQLAEKALKAFLYAQGEELVIGHSVRQLCQRAAVHETTLQDCLED